MKKLLNKSAGKKNVSARKNNGRGAVSAGKTNEPKSAVAGLKKLYLKSGSSCKVTFRLPKMAAPEAKSVAIAGDFNNWNSSRTLMKKLKSGDFTATLKLPCKKEYRFRYVIDNHRWENDWKADKYLPNEYGSDDSVVVV